MRLISVVGSFILFFYITHSFRFEKFSVVLEILYDQLTEFICCKEFLVYDVNDAIQTLNKKVQNTVCLASLSRTYSHIRMMPKQCCNFILREPFSSILNVNKKK